MSKSHAVSFYEEIEDETTLSSDVSDCVEANRVKDTVVVHNDDDSKRKKGTKKRRKKKDITAQKLKEIEEKIKKVQLLREKLKPVDPFQSINKKKKNISSNESISSVTTTKCKKTKLKLNHPHLEIVLGELMYSPYLISPAAKYPNEIYEIPKKLHTIKVSGKEFKDLPVDKVPYDAKEIEFKFREDILNFRPSYFGNKPVKSPPSTVTIDSDSYHDASYRSNEYNSKSSRGTKPRKLPPIKNKNMKRKSTPMDNSSVYTPCSTISDSDESIYSLFSFNDTENNYNDWNGIGDRLNSSSGQRRKDKNNNVISKISNSESTVLNTLKYDYVDVSLIEKQFESYHDNNNNNNSNNGDYYDDDWEDWEREYEKSRENIIAEPVTIKIIENKTEMEYITNKEDQVDQRVIIDSNEEQNINANKEIVSKDQLDTTDIESFQYAMSYILDAVEKRSVISAATRRTTEVLIDDILLSSFNKIMSR